MKRQIQHIARCLLTALLIVNPWLTNLAFGMACEGNSCCCTPGMSHQASPQEPMVKAHDGCGCNGGRVSSCSLNPLPRPENDWAIPAHFQAEMAGTCPVVFVDTTLQLPSESGVSTAPNGFHLSRSLSPPIYLTHLTLIC